MVRKMYEQESIEEELVQVFNEFDRDKDGDIGQEDLMYMMQQLGNTNFNLVDAKDMLDDIDRDDDAKINFLEFAQIMMYDTLD